MKKRTALIEKGKDGTFGIFTPDIESTIIGEGNTVAEAKADFDPTFTPKKFFHRNSGLFTRVRFCKSLIFNICFVSRRNICVL